MKDMAEAIYLPPDVERRMILDEARWVFELLELPPSSSIEGLELPWTPPAWNVPAHFLLGAVAARAILHETHERRRYGKVTIWRRRECIQCHSRGFLRDPWRLCDCATVRIQELET